MNFNYSSVLLKQTCNRFNPSIILASQRVPKRQRFEDALVLFNTSSDRTLKEFLEPEMYIPKMDPEFIPTYLKIMRKRKALCEPSPHPIYARLKFMRIWYRLSWYYTVVLAGYATFNMIWILANF